MSKESIIKKKLERSAKENPEPVQPTQLKKQRILRPVIVRKGRFGRRFFIMFSIWVIALAAALFFMSKQG